jgi:hypothetical protein
LRDAAEVARVSDRPTLRRDDADPGPLRTILTAGPGTGDTPDRPAHPVRWLLSDPVPQLLDALPLDPPATEPVPSEPEPTEPAPASVPLPAPDSHPIRETVEPVRETLPVGDGNVVDREPALLQR